EKSIKFYFPSRRRQTRFCTITVNDRVGSVAIVYFQGVNESVTGSPVALLTYWMVIVNSPSVFGSSTTVTCGAGVGATEPSRAICALTSAWIEPALAGLPMRCKRPAP